MIKHTAEKCSSTRSLDTCGYASNHWDSCFLLLFFINNILPLGTSLRGIHVPICPPPAEELDEDGLSRYAPVILLPHPPYPSER